MLWEASDRICGKRLKALIPTLVPAMERHGHLALATEIRTALLAMSAATIDRALRPQRERIGARTRRRGSPSAIRRSIAVRTFSDWGDPPPGFVEADLVAHSGPVTSGAFVQTLVLTDVAPGWTACAPLLVREQTLLVGVLTQLRRLMPFPLFGLDVDNDTVFMRTRPCAITAKPRALCSPAAGPIARTTKPPSSRRTARSCAASWGIAGSRACWRPRSWRASTRRRGCS